MVLDQMFYFDRKFLHFLEHHLRRRNWLLYSSQNDSEMPCGPRQDVPVGVPLDLSTPTGMSCIGTYDENCKSGNVSKHFVLLVAFQLL